MEFSTFKVLRNNVVIQATLVICYSGNLLLYPTPIKKNLNVNSL